MSTIVVKLEDMLGKCAVEAVCERKLFVEGAMGIGWSVKSSKRGWN